MVDIKWSAGRWSHPPAEATQVADDFHVTAVSGSDAWRHTSYGFVHDSENALLTSFPVDSAMEVEFTSRFSEQFDQAGVFVRVSAECWVKAGVEYADGQLQLGAVVTNPCSDWSLAPTSDWLNRRVTVRVSRSADALTVRAGVDGGAMQLVRVVPFSGDYIAEAGPFVCAPTRAGLCVPFHSWRLVSPDASLH